MHLFLSAGDVSGDLHAANLMRAIQTRAPDVRFSGLGGRAMREAGCELLEPIADSAVMGLARVLKRLAWFVRLLARTATYLEQERPDAVILVDYPGFNLNLAALARMRGLPSIYYICPQLWAWAPWRTRFFAKVVSHAITILPFEREYFARFGITADHVGHPVLDRLAALGCRPRPEPEREPLVALLPGSRSHEIEHNLPMMLAIALRLAARDPRIRFAAAQLSERGRSLIGALAREHAPQLELAIAGELPELVARARLALVTSGTATVEVALLRTPLMVFYRVASLERLLAPLLLTVPFIAQVNLIRGRRAFPEYLVARPDVDAMAATAARLYENGPDRTAALGELDALAAQLGRHGASEQAAASVLRFLANNARQIG